MLIKYHFPPVFTPLSQTPLPRFLLSKTVTHSSLATMDPEAVKSDLVLILDFGSQYTHLITRRIRSLSVFSLCISGTFPPSLPSTPKLLSFRGDLTLSRPMILLQLPMGSLSGLSPMVFLFWASVTDFTCLFRDLVVKIGLGRSRSMGGWRLRWTKVLVFLGERRLGIDRLFR